MPRFGNKQQDMVPKYSEPEEMAEHDTLLYMVDYLERKKPEVYGRYCGISTKDQMALYEDLLFFGVMRRL